MLSAKSKLALFVRGGDDFHGRLSISKATSREVSVEWFRISHGQEEQSRLFCFILIGARCGHSRMFSVDHQIRAKRALHWSRVLRTQL